MNEASPTVGSVVAVGEFDGFHRGQEQLLSAARRLARRSDAQLVAVILDDTGRRECLMEPAARARRALELGAAAAHVLTVEDGTLPDQTASVVAEVLEQTRPSQVVMACSPLMAPFGGWFPSMSSVFAERNTPVVQVPRQWGRSGEVSSRQVIRSLRDGDVDLAEEMLGRPASLSGVVVRGAGLGRTLGFATANLVPPERIVIPREGVYAAVAHHDGNRHMAAVNIGRRPTVEWNGAVLIEAHLLDFNGDLYGEHVELEFHHRLRPEQRFNGLDQLVAQLEKDIAAARRTLASLV